MASYHQVSDAPPTVISAPPAPTVTSTYDFSLPADHNAPSSGYSAPPQTTIDWSSAGAGSAYVPNVAVDAYPSRTGGTQASGVSYGFGSESHELLVDSLWYLVMLFVASIVVIASIASMNWWDAKDSYGLAAGIVSAVFSGAHFTYLKFFSGLPGSKLSIGLAVFLLVWWIPGILVLTFITDSPFGIPGNGYFASWLAFYCAFKLVNELALGGENLAQKYLGL
eukprot:gnl/Spiro4/2509_TR1210_c0_g1_i1.p1 gnl/Spiro4/2509_TR1210_c0_g1~~gnl/Spiro4/2509_TR1210_c0_g1_i1.p1  ORF type:complete len:239 (-),score=54.30 gnl/Spiro4/2509_TR1210_c0_g1_i1:41-709(-)